MAEIRAKSNVVFERNAFGQFAARCEKAAHETVKETVERGARTSRALAPSGKERWRYADRPGYVPLKRSIKTESGGTRGSWYSIAPHAMFVEMGTSAHLIHGKLHFSWSGGWFVWDKGKFQHPRGAALPTHHVAPGGSFYSNANASGAWVRHPGTAAQPFLRPAYEKVVRGQMMQIAKEKFPG